MIPGVPLDPRSGRPDHAAIDRLLEARQLDSVRDLLELAREHPGLVAAERNPPLYMDVSNAYSGDELGLPWRDVVGEGIIAAADLAVSAGAGNSVNIAAGAGYVLGDTNPALQPNYRIYNDAVVNRGISPDPALARRVRVIAQITDQSFAGSGRQWDLVALHGTPNASPVLPAEPASAISLANILVPAAAASSAAYTITDLRWRAKVGGGQVPGQITSTSTWAGGPPASPSDGDIWIATNVDANGTRWAFQYNAGSASAYKWEFIGGGEIFKLGNPNAVLNTMTQVGISNFWADATLQSYTVTRAGDWSIRGMFDINSNGGVQSPITAAVFAGGATIAGGALGATRMNAPLATAVSTDSTATVEEIVTGQAANNVIGIAGNSGVVATHKMQYTSMRIRPQRIA